MARGRASRRSPGVSPAGDTGTSARAEAAYRLWQMRLRREGDAVRRRVWALFLRHADARLEKLMSAAAQGHTERVVSGMVTLRAMCVRAGDVLGDPHRDRLQEHILARFDDPALGLEVHRDAARVSASQVLNGYCRREDLERLPAELHGPMPTPEREEARTTRGTVLEMMERLSPRQFRELCARIFPEDAEAWRTFPEGDVERLRRVWLAWETLVEAPQEHPPSQSNAPQFLAAFNDIALHTLDATEARLRALREPHDDTGEWNRSAAVTILPFSYHIRSERDWRRWARTVVRRGLVANPEGYGEGEEIGGVAQVEDEDLLERIRAEEHRRGRPTVPFLMSPQAGQRLEGFVQEVECDGVVMRIYVGRDVYDDHQEATPLTFPDGPPPTVALASADAMAGGTRRCAHRQVEWRDNVTHDAKLACCLDCGRAAVDVAPYHTMGSDGLRAVRDAPPLEGLTALESYMRRHNAHQVLRGARPDRTFAKARLRDGIHERYAGAEPEPPRILGDRAVSLDEELFGG